MTNPRVLVRKALNLFKYRCKISRSHHTCDKLSSWFTCVIISLDPFWVQLSYFIVLSLVGFTALKTTQFKSSSLSPNDVDLLFTSISAVTVSSMSTIDMEVFSNTQLIILTFLMFMGGEVLVSMLGLQFRRFKHRLTNHGFSSGSASSFDSTICLPECSIEMAGSSNDSKSFAIESSDQKYLKSSAIKSLGYVVLCYLLVVHFIGFVLAYIYIILTPSTKSILQNKDISRHTFSLFTIVSTFANCGFVPTNENMTIFKKNSGLLLILIPQILLGSTLYPVVLRAVILALEKITKRVAFDYMLKNSKEMGYGQLLPMVHTRYLAMTVFGLILVQFSVFCAVEWHNVEAMDGLNGYEKLIGSLFQVVNTRYAGETVFDLSRISPAILVGFVVMMYLPQLTTYLPIDDVENISYGDQKSQKTDQKKRYVEYILFSDLSYLIMFTILICFSERRKMGTDPLNFSLLSIVFEIVRCDKTLQQNRPIAMQPLATQHCVAN